MSGELTTDKPQSWRTTACGVLAVIGAVCVALTAMLDDDPATKVDVASIIKMVGGLLGAVGIGGIGLFAKDHRVHG